MYKDYFGFNTLPFSITPDPLFFYDNPSCREAFAGLRYGIEERKGFIVITGEAGTGKTTLVKVFMQRAEMKIRTAFIINPKLTAIKMLRFVLNDLGIVPSTQERGALTLQLNDYLLEQLQERHVVALLVDEAQQLSNELLEELRLLSNLETNKEKLIQIVLLGQPELEVKLDQPELRQLKQRVTLRCRLAPLSNQDVHLYIQARLRTAGFEEEALFDPKAVEKIALYANGIPRLINVICDNALLSCYALSQNRVSAEIIEEAACDFQLTARPPIATPLAPIETETLKNRPATGDKTRTLERMDPSTSVLQRPQPEFPGFFMGEEQQRTRIHWRWRLAGLGTGFVCGVLAAAGLGAIFYSQSYRPDISDRAPRIGEEVNRHNSLTTDALEPGDLHEDPSKELKDFQVLASEQPPISTQQPGERAVGANATPIPETSETALSQATDSPERSQEQQTVKNDKEDQEKTKTAAKRTSKNQVGVAHKPTNDRLLFEIYKAIANRAIAGIGVSVIDGTVVLGGRVATESQKIAAGQAARSVPGVKNVRNQILVNDGVAPQYSDTRADRPSFGG
jgi:general secretion pathway protein A